MATITDLLLQAIPRLAQAGVDSPRLDAELLLAQAIGKDRRWLISYPEYTLTPLQEACFHQLLQRRLQREPLAYILGEWEFYGRSFIVTAAVLVPRPETELLVEAVLVWARRQQAARIVDVGTGSGAIAVTLAAEIPSLHLYAIDLSPEALAIARQNAERHGVAQQIDFLQGDLLQPLSESTPLVAAIVANLPYIAEEEMPHLMPEVRDYEPRLALAAQDGGLGIVFRLIEQAPAHLIPGGLLALELGQDQAGRVIEYLIERQWHDIRIITDYAGIERHILAERPVTRI